MRFFTEEIVIDRSLEHLPSLSVSWLPLLFGLLQRKPHVKGISFCVVQYKGLAEIIQILEI